HEWCAPMLKDAALAILDLLLELDSLGLTLKDGHPWNVLFDAHKPVYVDLTSIIPSSGPDWPGLDEFSRFCIYPLFMMANGNDRAARCLMAEYEGVTRSEARSLGWRWNTSRFVFNRLRSRTSRFINRMIPGVKHRRRDSRQLLKDLRRDLETIDVE